MHCEYAECPVEYPHGHPPGDSHQWRRLNTDLDLIGFLTERLNEDEAWIQGDGARYLDECQECGFGQQPDSPYPTARMLAEVEAKRQLLNLHQPQLSIMTDETVCAECVGAMWPCDTIHIIGTIYQDHPQFQTEWSVS